MNRKKLLCSTLILTLGLSIAPFTQQGVQAATIDSKQDTVVSTSKSGQTPITYKNWLNEKIKNSNDASEKADLKTALKKFESLSTSDQEKFLNYINDSNFVINSLKKGTNSKSKKTIINNDVSFTVSKDTVKDTSQSLYSTDSTTVTKKGQVSNTLTILGIDILKTTAWVRYHHDDSTVTSVDSSDFMTSRNLLPGCSSSWSEPDEYIDDDGRAVATADITFNFIYKGWGPTIGSAQMGVRGDADENIDGWLTPYES